jgi:hypothetical protein
MNRVVDDDDLDRGAVIDAWLARFDGEDLALHQQIAEVLGAHADVDVTGRRLLSHLERCGGLPKGWRVLMDLLLELVWRGFVDDRLGAWFDRVRVVDLVYWSSSVPVGATDERRAA